MDNKYYEINVENLKYGKVKKEYKDIDYRTAVALYVDTQKRFKKVQCDIVLNEVNVNEETGKKNRKIQYKNTLGKEFSLEKKLLELQKLVEEIQIIKDYHFSKSQSGTNDFNDVRHAIEIGAANDLTPEQCKNIFVGINDSATIRRASLLEADKIKACSNALNSIKVNVNKCLDECKKCEQRSSTTKAKENAKIADEMYVNTLLSLCEGSV